MYVRICHRFADGSEVDVEMGCEEAAYPDELSQLAAEVVRVYGEVVTG